MKIIKIHGRGVEFEQAGEAEGWRVEQIPNANFARKVVFVSEEAQVMFHLKYGYGK